jgi:hypothetical protein
MGSAGVLEEGILAFPLSDIPVGRSSETLV